MIFIGEKINGTIPKIMAAIIARDEGYIAAVAKMQAEAGSDYLDINAGTDPSREADDMAWLIEVVQNAVETPICIDSSSAATLARCIHLSKKTPLVNSVNADKRRLDAFLPLVAEMGASVIALCMDESKTGMPKGIEGRMECLEAIFAASRAAGIADEKIFVDPLIMSISTDQTAGCLAFDCIRAIKSTYPQAHITGGLSNISFGLPNRSLINSVFLTLAIEAGMDSAVVNPADTQLISALKATDMLLGADMFCRKYTTAAKSGFARK